MNRRPAPDRMGVAPGGARGSAGASEIGPIDGAVHVWLVRTPPADDPVADAAIASLGRDILSADEAASVACLRRPEDRRRAALTRVHVRTTLSRYTSVPPESWRFTANAHGRPEIESPAATGLHFSVSHTRELVACAVARGFEVGVDVETSGRGADLAAAEGVFTDDELDALRALAPADRPARRLRLWTLREACLKARGLGFTIDPREVSFVLRGAGGIDVAFGQTVPDDPAAWWFSVADVDAAHVMALAARRRAPPAAVAVFLLDAVLGAWTRVR